ncbi:UNVERIFIED_CONTAM: hypothetical protein K2H54_061505 [Gekko kuhli]
MLVSIETFKVESIQCSPSYAAFSDLLALEVVLFQYKTSLAVAGLQIWLRLFKFVVQSHVARVKVNTRKHWPARSGCKQKALQNKLYPLFSHRDIFIPIVHQQAFLASLQAKHVYTGRTAYI